jgi:hypothetical protein
MKKALLPVASILLNTASALGLAFLVMLATGSKGSPSADSDAAATTSSASDSDFKVSVSGRKLPNYETIRGTCDNRSKGQCDEFYGLIPKFSPDSCKDEGGVFQTSTPKPNPCPKANLIGTCHYEQRKTGDPGQFANYYASHGATAAALKKDCLSGDSSKTEWIDAPPPPAPALPAASASAPARPAAPVAKAATKPSVKPAPSGAPSKPAAK